MTGSPRCGGLCKVYTDEGISAVTTRHRDGFNEMVADALAGKIDIKTA